MNSETRNMINSLTEDIISSYGFTIPIDVEYVVERLGGAIQEKESFSDGEIKKAGERFEIFVSPFQDDRRRRFTIAHELGHLFLHMGYLINEELWNQQDTNTYYRVGSSEKEYQANEFAAAFLMPRDIYLEQMNENMVGNQVNTARIAEFFNVSVEAASNRGKFLGYLKW